MLLWEARCMGCALILKTDICFFMQLGLELEVSRRTSFSLKRFQSVLCPPLPRSHEGVLLLGPLEIGAEQRQGI